MGVRILSRLTNLFALSVLATPILVKLLVGAVLPVDPWAMFRSMIVIVLLPLLAGVLLNQFDPPFVRHFQPFAPLVSMALIILIVGCVIAIRRDMIAASALSLVAAVTMLHVGGFALGYGFARVFGFDDTYRRTLSIEVGMQNGGLGVALAREHFVATPLTAVPSALSAIVACVVGSFAAAWWRVRPAPNSADYAGSRSDPV